MLVRGLRAHSTGHTSAIGRSQMTMPPECVGGHRFDGGGADIDADCDVVAYFNIGAMPRSARCRTAGKLDGNR
ncbi:hypothetical protein ACNJQJ_21255, partial [Mycobacterium tuberculosis]